MKSFNIKTQLGILLFLITILFTNCKQTKKESNDKTPFNTSIENFDSFYDKFHKDSLFQISRIKFPLKGEIYENNTQIVMTKENWPILITKVYDVDTTRFKVSYEKLETSFTEKIWIVDSGFSCEHRFELIDNEWFLVYAMENND